MRSGTGWGTHEEIRDGSGDHWGDPGYTREVRWNLWEVRETLCEVRGTL